MEIQNYPNYLIYEDGRVFSKKSKRWENFDAIKFQQDMQSGIIKL